MGDNFCAGLLESPPVPTPDNRAVSSNPSLSANSLSQPIDFIGLSLEQIEAIPHSVPHFMGTGINLAKTNFSFQNNSFVDCLPQSLLANFRRRSTDAFN
jgi:hypothetical protein